jgi:hypothetical protein
MARRGIRSRKDIDALYNTAALQRGIGVDPVLKTQLILKSGIRNGYLNALNRQQRKTPKQLKGLTTSGHKLVDWAI